MLDWLNKILGDPNQRKIKKLEPIVDQIHDLEPELQKLSDTELRAKTNAFRQELDNRERADNPKRDRELEAAVLELLLPEAFAVVREAGRRVLNMRHFDVQMLGGMVLHKGGIAEMRTGEGKTLVATLPAYLNALSGKGVHIVTVNDYLARRDAEWMGTIYQFLGLSVGLVLSQQRGFDSAAEKKYAYGCDITYGTNNEFGFDYLRDNMAGSLSQLCQRPYNYAIIDEVDSILIDEARTPLIISGRLEQSADTYRMMARIAPSLQKERDYTVDEKARNVVLTEEGIDRAQELLNVDDLFDLKTNLAHHLLQALKSKELFRRDIDYVVKDNQVVIVDEFTGRLMEGRRWSDGLHQAVEAKEGVSIQDETQTLASITFQNLFRLYPKLSGMTGTAMTEEAEFGKIYNLEVTATPTNRSDVRTDYPDVIYKNEKIKFYKVIEEIVECHEQGRPVLVGTTSIEKSEWISSLLTTPMELTQHLREKAARLVKQLEKNNEKDLLTEFAGMLRSPEAQSPGAFARAAEKYAQTELADWLKGLEKTLNTVLAIRKGLPHHVLNAKHHEQEAFIVAQAGRYQAVTIATNMAGRGTDILLGGNPEYLAKAELAEKNTDWRSLSSDDYERLVREKKTITEAEKAKVVEAGGLHIIGTERHESRRIDNQLRGRAARQGDPGSTKFYLSLEDHLMRIFGGQKVAGLMDLLNVDETMPISAGMVSKVVEGSQRKVEAYHFDLRKNILKYDDVLTEQRRLIYEQRRRVLEGHNLREQMLNMMQNAIARIVPRHISAERSQRDEEWDSEALHALMAEMSAMVPAFADIEPDSFNKTAYKDILNTLQSKAQEAYEALESEMTRVAEDLANTHGIRLLGLEDEHPTEGSDDQATTSLANRHPLRRVERDVLLAVVDAKWIDYLHNLDSLREGIGLRAYGQKDPLIEYKREAFEMFQTMTYDIQEEAVSLLFRARIEIQLDQLQTPVEEEFVPTALTEAMEDASLSHEDIDSYGVDTNEQLSAAAAGQPVSVAQKPQRNDLCPCGSGKKFKKCHGA